MLIDHFQCDEGVDESKKHKYTGLEKDVVSREVPAFSKQRKDCHHDD